MKRLSQFLVLLLLPAMLWAQTTTVSYSKSTDFGGAFNAANFDAEIRASAITRALSGVDESGDDIDVVFNGGDSLPQADLDLLQGASYPSPIGGLIAAHDPVAKVTASKVSPSFTVDAHRAKLDGTSIQCDQDQWCTKDISLPEDLHLQEAYAVWKNGQLGDYVLVAVVNPAAESTTSTTASATSTEVDVGAGEAPYYDPVLASAEAIEFWDGTGETANLLEVRDIDHLDGTTVHMVGGLSQEIPAGTVTKVRLSAFSPLRGPAGTDGGFYFLGDAFFQLTNPHTFTELLTAGLVFSTRIRTADVAGTRQFAANFIFRTPEE